MVYDIFNMPIRNNEYIDKIHQMFQYFFEIKPIKQG